jgi:hypothetical protein
MSDSVFLQKSFRPIQHRSQQLSKSCAIYSPRRQNPWQLGSTCVLQYVAGEPPDHSCRVRSTMRKRPCIKGFATISFNDACRLSVIPAPRSQTLYELLRDSCNHPLERRVRGCKTVSIVLRAIFRCDMSSVSCLRALHMIIQSTELHAALPSTQWSERCSLTARPVT